MKSKRAQVEEALATEIRNGDVGRCYGLALALAILVDSSTDEELWRVAEANGLMDVAVPMFKWTVGRS